MRWHLGIALAVVLAAGGWFAYDSGERDPGYLRDRLVAGDVVATYSSGFTEGYRFTLLRDEGWLWERLGRGGTPFGDALLHIDGRTLLRVDDRCWVSLRDVRLPFVPGVTVPRALSGKGGIERDPDHYYRYSLEPGETAPAGVTRAAAVDVTEDVRDPDGEGLRITTAGTDPSFWYGTYRVRAATDADRARWAELASGARPSAVARMEVRERIVGSPVGNNVTGPFTLVVAGDCQDRPVLIRPAAAGGQRLGPRLSQANVRFGPGQPPVVRDAVDVPIAIHAQFTAEAPLAEVARNLGDVPLRERLVVLVRNPDGVLMAVQFQTCEPQPFFLC